MIARLTLSLLATAALLVAAAAPAAANPPQGDWTFVRKDSFRHYACKAKAETKGRWRVRTATWFNGRESAIEHGIGAYAALARGANKNLVDERTRTDWRGGYIRLTLHGALADDRLWVQGAYYGPAEPWSDGIRVAKLTRC